MIKDAETLIASFKDFSEFTDGALDDTLKEFVDAISVRKQATAIEIRRSEPKDHTVYSPCIEGTRRFFPINH